MSSDPEWVDCVCARLSWQHDFCELCAHGNSRRTRIIPTAMRVELSLTSDWWDGGLRYSEISRLRTTYGLIHERMDALLIRRADRPLSNILREEYAEGWHRDE